MTDFFAFEFIQPGFTESLQFNLDMLAHFITFPEYLKLK